MLKFDEEKQRASIDGALKLRQEINQIADKLHASGYARICWLGIGGTYASCMQVVTHMKEKTGIEIFVENAAEFCTTGNQRVDKDTIVVISSVTGSTSEVIEGVKKAQAQGAVVVGFVDVETTELAKMVDYEIAYPANEQLKFFMLADRFMYLAGEFPAYDAFYKEMDAHLSDALIAAEKEADAFGQAFAEKHKDDKMHYFVGAGNQWGATYSYAMCYWEEQHWIPTKSIHAAEFFHGMFEIIERDTPVTIFITEDSQRYLGKRVADFIPRICGNYTVIDTADYALEGFSKEFRGHISHLVIRVVTNRIDAYLEKINCHPMEIRRYYRQLAY